MEMEELLSMPAPGTSQLARISPWCQWQFICILWPAATSKCSMHDLVVVNASSTAEHALSSEVAGRVACWCRLDFVFMQVCLSQTERVWRLWPTQPVQPEAKP